VQLGSFSNGRTCLQYLQFTKNRSIYPSFTAGLDVEIRRYGVQAAGVRSHESRTLTSGTTQSGLNQGTHLDFCSNAIHLFTAPVSRRHFPKIAGSSPNIRPPCKVDMLRLLVGRNFKRQNSPVSELTSRINLQHPSSTPFTTCLASTQRQSPALGLPMVTSPLSLF
jgi:hypothetical protein